MKNLTDGKPIIGATLIGMLISMVAGLVIALNVSMGWGAIITIAGLVGSLFLLPKEER